MALYPHSVSMQRDTTLIQTSENTESYHAYLVAIESTTQTKCQLMHSDTMHAHSVSTQRHHTNEFHQSYHTYIPSGHVKGIPHRVSSHSDTTHAHRHYVNAERCHHTSRVSIHTDTWACIEISPQQSINTRTLAIYAYN